MDGGTDPLAAYTRNSPANWLSRCTPSAAVMARSWALPLFFHFKALSGSWTRVALQHIREAGRKEAGVQSGCA